jgi:hypothetical protein
MLRLASIFALTLAISLAEAAPPVLGHGTFVSRAVFADGQLWLLSGAGVLSSVTKSKDDKIEVVFPDPTLDLWLHDRQPAVITCKRAGCTDWTLRRRSSDGQWSIRATIAAQGDDLIAVAGNGATITVLSRQRLIEVHGEKQSAITLSGFWHQGAITSTFVTPTSVFVGFSAGEWGGGLQRIDRTTGEIAPIERNDPGTLCGGPLNTACHPVRDIAAVPWEPECVAVAVGLVHGAPTGGIVEVCEDIVRQLYTKPLPQSIVSDSRGGEPYPSVAFFGLARQDDALWTVGIDGIYRIGPDAMTREHPLPTFKNIGEFGVSFDLPGLVLVLENAKYAKFIKEGFPPILVPR